MYGVLGVDETVMDDEEDAEEEKEEEEDPGVLELSRWKL
jgi:hypothetical protein